MRRFKNFACIDWSGALGERPKGLAAAYIGQDGPPQLLTPSPRWSRMDILHWLKKLAAEQTDILIGMDLSFGFPFHDRGCYFPQWPESPSNARQLWQIIDTICDTDLHLSATSFLQHTQARRHFRHAKGDVGDLFEGGIGRLRVVEHQQRITKQANSWSCFNLVGAGQVGKSSLTGMRLLHRLNGQIPVWPFDPIPQNGPVLVEIYTSMAARAAGLPANRSKVRDRETLIDALAQLETSPPARLKSYDDHSTDALMTAAWLRNVAEDSGLWQPYDMNDKIAATEGWTFGIR